MELKGKPFEGLVMTPERVICSFHAMPLKSEWPKGYAQMSLRMLEAWNKRGIYEGLFVETTPGSLQLDIAKVHEELDKKPLCCQLTKDEMMAIYIKLPIGCERRCDGCGLRRRGTPLDVLPRALKHVCFHCFLYRATRQRPELQ